MAALKRKKRFRDLHRALNEHELAELVRSIKEEGQRDPIVVWGDVIIDGDHRETICKTLGLEPKVQIMQFASDDEAELWILRHQLARRNLSPADFKAAIGKLYNAQKKASNRPKELPQNEGVNGETAEWIAEEHGVSRATVERAGKREENLAKLPKGIKEQIANEPKLASDKAVAKLATLDTGQWQEVGRAVRVGQKPTFDSALFGRQPVNGKPDEPDWWECYAAIHKRAVDDINRILRDVEEITQSQTGEYIAVSFARVRKSLTDAKATLWQMMPMAERKGKVVTRMDQARAKKK